MTKFIGSNEKNLIFIPGNIPSLKNSKVMTKRGIVSSPTVNKFIRSLGIQRYSAHRKEVKGYVDPNRPNQFKALEKQFKEHAKGKDYPLLLGVHQVRDSKRKFDFSNSIELIQDLLVAHDFIEDDNVEFLFTVPMTIDGELPTEDNFRDREWYSVDKDNPGAYIKIF